MTSIDEARSKIIDLLKDARKQNKYSSVVSLITRYPFDDLKAQAFLIHLARTTISDPHKVDIVLSSWRLLNEVRDINRIMERRRVYKHISGYTNSIDALGDIEDNLYSTLADKCIVLRRDSTLLDAFCVEANNYIVGDHVMVPPLQPYPVDKRNKFAPRPSYIMEDGRICLHCNLPFRASPFAGRQEILNKMASDSIEMPYDPNRRHCGLLVLSGEHGIGKTSIARKFADKYDDTYSTILSIDASTHESLFQDCKEFILTYCPTSVSLKTDVDVKAAFKNFFVGQGLWLIIFDGADYDQASNNSQEQWENLWEYIPSDRRGTIIITTTSESDTIMGIKPIRIPPFTPQEIREFANSVYLSPSQRQLLIDYGGCTPLSLKHTLWIIMDMLRKHGTGFDPITKPSLMKEFMMHMQSAPHC